MRVKKFTLLLIVKKKPFPGALETAFADAAREAAVA
jgi:hypothetical protein